MKEIVKIQSEYGIDCIVSTYAPPSAHILAYRVKERFPEVKWISDYRDSWTVSNYVFPGLPVVRNFEKHIEDKIIQSTDLITAVSPTLVDEFRSRFPNKRVELVENGFLDEINPTEAINLGRGINLVYTGSYGGYRTLKFLDDFLRKLKHEDKDLYEKINIYVVGRGKESFENEKIFFLGDVPYEMSIAYQNAADILFIVESDQEIAKGALTGKLFEYLRAKKPIIAFGPTEDSDLAKYLRETGAGIVSKKDYQSVYNAIKFAISSKVTINDSKIDRFSRKNLALKFLSLIEDLCTTKE